ncbi:sensor domain-containing diguanylate cyclase [Vibrio sp. ZSDZ34]|uniref:diguanylate cyclase n=1 Tax=Vibrio gelatinilyticus TaxID=2893468 RepID=A0A9X1WCI6_9VIBR|nr:sensor domain-containing diguanylate cyclase [Vibrio gelatinilyticus]MCJ2378407.1 sensor domain-containing diguanylate cyclase [Vibrio gelatinilyticus]
MSKELLLEAHKSINTLLRDLALGLPKNELDNKIILLSERLFSKRIASIIYLDPLKRTLHSSCAPNLPSFYTQAINGIEIGPNVGACGAAAYHKKTIITENIAQHDNWRSFAALTQKANLNACWSVPIISVDNQVLGTLAIYSEEADAPSDVELELLESLASVYSVAIEKYRLEEKLHFQAQYDSLTHCLNRRALLEKVSESNCFKGNRLGCFFVDIDRFKQVNDKYGHQFGDKVLKKVASTLKSLLPEDAILGRYGGDEFLAFYCFPNEVKALAFFNTLRQELNQPLVLEQSNIDVSVGFAIKTCCSDLSIDHLIRLADVDMYKKKKQNQLKSCLNLDQDSSTVT